MNAVKLTEAQIEDLLSLVQRVSNLKTIKEGHLYDAADILSSQAEQLLKDLGAEC